MQEPYIGHKLISCTFKKAFELCEAKKLAKIYNQHYYKCNYCNKYHLTKQITYESIMEE